MSEKSTFIKEAPRDFIRKSGLLCVKMIDEGVELKGMYHANEFQYIEIAFEVCPMFGEKEGIECAPLSEIADYLDGLPIQVTTFKPNFKLGKSLESNFAL